MLSILKGKLTTEKTYLLLGWPMSASNKDIKNGMQLSLPFESLDNKEAHNYQVVVVQDFIERYNKRIQEQKREKIINKILESAKIIN